MPSHIVRSLSLEAMESFLMKSVRYVFFLLLVSVRLGALAADMACPDLKTAVQVGACPTPEQLQYTYFGYCSDDTKAYKGETDVCADFQRYRKLKNVALWESPDGAFDAYVSCDLAKDRLQQAKVIGMQLAKQGKVTRVVCSYDLGVQFTHRTHAQCKPGAGACGAANPGACSAQCE